MSAAFERFKYSFFEDPTSAQDALDIPSLAALGDDERDRAEAMLIAFLPDARAVIGLGELRSHKAEAELIRLFDAERKQQLEAGPNKWYPSKMLYLARALWRIRPDSRCPQAAIEVLSSARDWVFRQEAIEALYGINEPTAVQALAAALDDATPLVRYAAARGLLLLHGLPAQAANPQNMMIRLMSKDAARHASGKRDLLSAIAGRTIIET
jgi:HEAT repeat protein